MNMTETSKLPPNIREFNDITAIIFSQLYISFPVPRSLSPDEIALLLAIKRTDQLESGRPFNEVFAHTLQRLIKEGYIESLGLIPTDRCVLTTKAMAAMNVTPERLEQPLGSELNEITKDAAPDKSRIAQWMGDFIGAFTGAMVKSIGPGFPR
jgi:hypothetical protein